jgi:hypothetical protein
MRFARVANLSVLWLSSKHATAGLMEQMIATRPLPYNTIIEKRGESEREG